MNYRRFGEEIVLRVDRGEEALSAIRSVCAAEGVALASFTGLGAAGRIRAGLYRVAEKKYFENVFEGEFEILSLTGNVTRREGEVYLHAHVAFADAEGRAYGGHLNECVISATAEIFLHVVSGEAGRLQDEETGLNLMAFGPEL